MTHCYTDVRENVSSEIANEINVATFKYVKSCSSQKTPRNLYLTKQYLKEHDLLAVPFDKGVGICLMRRETYEKKMSDILKLDQFAKLEKPRKNSKEWAIKEQERINEALKHLKMEGKISEELVEKLKSKGGQPPRLYGLAKVHKTGIPMRPVLSMPGSPYYNIAETVTKWLSVVPESKSQCNTKKIANQLKNIELEEGEELVSFDVVSLYTNVPVLEAIDVAADRLYCGDFEVPPVSKETFTELMKLASTKVIMLTHDEYYIQNDGLAMGSPPAPSLANIWLARRESVIKDTAKLFERYMDDIIRSIKHEKIEEKLQQINNIHANLKFTIEVEQDGRIPFLDMLLIRNGNKLTSTWYCKPTDTGLVMNFHALAPRRYKRAVVSGFIHRIHRACSTWENFHTSLQKAKEILEKNQYSPHFYESVIKDTIERIITPVNAEERENGVGTQQKHLILLQYRGPATDKFIKKLKECGAPTQVVLTLRKLRSYLPSLKSPIPKMLKSDVVYKVTCPRCQTCYVGKTSRHLSTRFAEERTKKKEQVYQHVKSCRMIPQKLTEKDVEVLATVPKGGFQLAIREALFIRELCPGINTRDEYRDHELTIKI